MCSPEGTVGFGGYLYGRKLLSIFEIKLLNIFEKKSSFDLDTFSFSSIYLFIIIEIIIITNNTNSFSALIMNQANICLGTIRLFKFLSK